MNMRKLFLALCLCIQVVVMSSVCYAAKAPMGFFSTLRAVSALAETAEIEFVSFEMKSEWLSAELLFRDELHPLTINIVSTNLKRPKEVVYFIPGGTSFVSSFFTPKQDNLAHFYRRNGYFVVGITPREKSMTAEDDTRCMETWGLAKHRDDIRRIVEIVQSALAIPYELFGYSIGGEYALDYAATYPGEAARVTVLGLESFYPDDLQQVSMAGAIYNAAAFLMSEGVFNDDSLSALKGLAYMAMLDPTGDSGESREAVGLPGNFTFEGLAHFSGIYTGMLPGFHTSITGLPGEWWNQSNLAGTYNFALDPLMDSYAFDFTDLETLYQGVLSEGSGFVPLAVWRDNAAVNSHNGAYEIPWEAIDAPVIWINGEAGMGNLFWGAEQIREAGNDAVTQFVLPAYGHADLTWSRSARTDLWPLLLPKKHKGRHR